MVDRAFGASESRTSRKHLKWPSYRWRLVLVGAVISALVGGSTFYGLGAFFSPLQSEFNWSFSVLSGAFAVQYAVSGVATLIFGWFFDRIHPAYLAWVLEALVEGQVLNEIVVPDRVKAAARVALDRMLRLPGQAQPAMAQGQR